MTWSGIALSSVVCAVGVVALIAYLVDASIPGKELALARDSGAPLTIEEIDAFYTTSPEIDLLEAT